MKSYTISDFLRRVKNPIDLDDSTSYKRVTIKTNHQGVYLRDTEIGARIGTKKQFVINGGDFILSKIDARYGAFGIIPQELDGAIITGNFWTYRVDTSLVDSEWFFYFTHSYNFIEICKESSAGTTHRKYLDETRFLNHKIDLPSISDQAKMVKRYKGLSKISNNCLTEIQTQKQLLSQLKQSILQEAIQGKLTTDWRVQNPNVEPASGLLERIKSEKQKLIDEKKIKKEKPLPPITADEIPFDLPEGWVWCRLGEIIELISGQDFDKSGFSEDNKEGVPYLTGASNLKDEKVILNRWTKAPRSIARNGDLLLTCKGSGVGKMAFLDHQEVHIARQLMAIRSGIIDLSYIKYLLATKLSLFQDEAKSLIPGIDRPMVLNIVVPLPTLLEIEAIVHKVESLMDKCRALETEITQSEQHAQHLMQAVLKEAFESEDKSYTNPEPPLSIAAEERGEYGKN
ncbi:restriction endonuclease subunit S [Marinoscillum pacificum]|uniref:restriction endonuclease subunit S n=1 Tax=Marinoscillum pacificum TaxID=392723 RepID=UPI0021580538|nr:restriction endonuclease subunit S [Marinoscillum pacificum]